MAADLYGEDMIYRNLGHTGVKVSPLCLGCFNFGTRIPSETASALIALAIDKGINFFDTASSYGPGHSESVLGEAVAVSGKRDRLILASKCFFPTDESDVNARGNSRRHIIQECEASLRRLKTDWIDIYYLHRPDPETTIDESLRALEDLIRAGKIRYSGTSTFPAWKIVDAMYRAKISCLTPISVEQPPYNLLDRRIERELVPMAQENGIGLVCWSPLARGFLTGRYTMEGKTGETSSRFAQGVANADMHYSPTVFEVIQVIECIAKQHQCSIAEVALAWTMAQPAISSVIFGASCLDQMHTALGSMSISLTAADFSEIDKVAKPGRALVPYYESCFAPTQRPSHN